MDYEKKYKEALELMKDCIPDGNGLVHIRPCDYQRTSVKC